MFTGIIEEVGSVKEFIRNKKLCKLTITCSKILEDIKLGDSIAVNGICLTAAHIEKNCFCADVMPETFKSTSLENLGVNDRVNLERALRLSDRLGGHIVTGHIDGIGVISNIKNDENSTRILIKVNKEILKYIVKKGSVTLDGVSLTIVNVNKDIFEVSIIPTTKEETILLNKGIGDIINIECDVVGKYIEKFCLLNKEDNSNITKKFLYDNGFM